MKLALIGKGKGKEDAPFKGNGVVTWGVNDIVGHRDVDVCFFMDRHLMSGTQMEELVVRSVEKTGTPVYCIEHYDDIPSSISYPRDEIFQVFGTDYFADSFCYMLALAIYKGFKELDIYGFNYAFGEKYIEEKPAVSMWLGMALGSGCTLSFWGEYCDLFKTKDNKVYSYLDIQSFPRQGIKIKGFKPSKKTYKFSVNDRFTILGMLPLSGNYNEMKFTQKFHEFLSFTMEENKKLNIRGIEDKKDSAPKIIWDETDIPDREIDLDSSEVAMLSTWFYGLEQRGGLTLKNLKLFERFCSGRDINNLGAA